MATVKASPERLRLRAKLGVTLRDNPDADTTELRRELKTEKLADYIRALVDTAPPLTGEQRDRLATLLRGGSER